MNSIQEMKEDLFDLYLSQGTIAANNHNMIAKLKPFETIVKAQLIKASYLHLDKPSTRIQKLTSWIHLATFGHLFYLYPHKKRGKEAILYDDILTYYRSIVIHDHWKSYFKFQNYDHADVCSIF